MGQGGGGITVSAYPAILTPLSENTNPEMPSKRIIGSGLMNKLRYLYAKNI